MAKLEWLKEKSGVWNIIGELDETAHNFYYRAMHDNHMDLYDADDYAWLNTLIGYDIGVKNAKRIEKWLYENDETVTSYSAENIGTLKNLCELELELKIDFSNAVTVTPEAIKYTW